jgi:ferrochelatase
MTEAVVRSVKRFVPDRIVLLPLYPQFSTTTTASSFKEWNDTASFKVPTTTIESYPTEPGFIAASVELVKQGLAEAGAGPGRVLFSAHGLPERVIKAGDPYQAQVEQTAKAIADGLGEIDWSICYQSRVGPLKWIGPSTDAEIRRAGADKVGVVIYPLAFVSEHSETLVELDIDYRHLAKRVGITTYIRVPTVGTHPLFVAGLARLVRDAL